ncbi:MAG: TonB-dependent receptor [Rhodospirillaceae bacterium]|nr:TonB-dependent receptor [Rhodospirillaceae bacterium]
MWLESKPGRRGRKPPYRRMVRRSAALWCLALALAVGPPAAAAYAGSLAPAPRVIAKYERNFLERSGSQTLGELLNTGIIRYFLTGGQSLPVMVNGRPYSSTSGDLDTLPVSAIERIELLSGDSLGTQGASALRGALNIVLRTDLDGFETRALARLPAKDGGDGLQGSVFWGGSVGKGRMTLGVDILRRQEIPSRSRDYSRSVWQEGGTFPQAKNVSPGGNTVWVNESGGTEVRSAPLGACDPAKGYTGRLSNPPGVTVETDEGCGFAYGDIAWNTNRVSRKTLILNLDYPLGNETELHVDANVGQGDSAFRYAPPVGTFGFTPSPALITAINTAAGTTIAASGDSFLVSHRFVGHGNRDWHTKWEEYDISVGVEGRFTEWLGYDARLEARRFDSSLSGNTFVHTGRIRAAINEGRYNLADPFSKDPDHLQAIAFSSVREEIDSGSEYLGTRLALEGGGFSIGGRSAAWTVGVKLSREDGHELLRFRSRDGETHSVTEVLGSGGVSYAGRRKTVTAFAELSLPLTDKLDFRVAGTRARADDVGGLTSWSLGASYRLSEILTLRSSWSAGQIPPSMLSLHSTAAQSHPYVGCVPDLAEDPPRPCTSLNARQVTREITGNPRLDPSDNKRLAIGVEARKWPYFLGVEWYRLSSAGAAGLNRADWAIRNLEVCEGDNKSNCIDRAEGITIYDSFANVVDTELQGVTARFGGGFRTSWGIFGARGAWRHVTRAKRRVAGNSERYVIPRNMVRAGFLASRGNLSFIWTSNYRSGFRNSAGTGEFKSWFGHDAVLDWKAPMGLNGARITAGVFNVTDAKLSVDSANPSSVDGPTEAGWGRTFFFTFNAQW